MTQLCKNPKPDGSWCGVPVEWREIEPGKKRPFEVDTNQIHNCPYYKPKSQGTTFESNKQKFGAAFIKKEDYTLIKEIQNFEKKIDSIIDNQRLIHATVISIAGHTKAIGEKALGKDVNDEIIALTEKIALLETDLKEVVDKTAYKTGDKA